MVAARTARSAPARRSAAGGFTLVEFMIVLVVIGLLMGSALVPMATRSEDGEFAEERENIEELRAAVIGFAAQNRTIERTVVIDNRSSSATDSPATVWEEVIPGGRPYLPCPDLDGDGYEDRLLPEDPPRRITLTAAADYRELYAAGACASNMGLLPWRSLGVEATDTWGNLYAYRVHDSFSNRVTGFDHQTRADIYDESSFLATETLDIAYTTHMTVSAAPTQYVASVPETDSAHVAVTVYNRLDKVSPEDRVDPTNGAVMRIEVEGTRATMTLNRYPMIVCSPTPASPTVSVDSLCLGDAVAGDLVQLSITATASPPLPAVELDSPREGPAGPLVARIYGHPVAEDIATDPSAIITDGAVFGIVSYGKNGNGAIKLLRWTVRGTTDLECSSSPAAYQGLHPETVHIYWLYDLDLPTRQLNNRCKQGSIHDGLEHYGRRMMFWMPRTGNRTYHLELYGDFGNADPALWVYDDVTGWVGPNELIGKLARGGVFPVRAMPYLGVPDMLDTPAPRGGAPTTAPAAEPIPSGVQFTNFPGTAGAMPPAAMPPAAMPPP